MYEAVDVSDDDMNFLKRIKRDKREQMLHRVCATQSKGYFRWLRMDRSGAARDYRSAIEMARNASTADRAKEIQCTHPRTGVPAVMPSGVMMDDIAAKAASNLRNLEESDARAGGADSSASYPVSAVAQEYPQDRDFVAEATRSGAIRKLSEEVNGLISGSTDPNNNDAWRLHRFHPEICSSAEHNALLDVTASACNACGRRAADGRPFKRCAR